MEFCVGGEVLLDEQGQGEKILVAVVERDHQGGMMQTTKSKYQKTLRLTKVCSQFVATLNLVATLLYKTALLLQQLVQRHNVSFCYH